MAVDPLVFCHFYCAPDIQRLSYASVTISRFSVTLEAITPVFCVSERVRIWGNMAALHSQQRMNSHHLAWFRFAESHHIAHAEYLFGPASNPTANNDPRATQSRLYQSAGRLRRNRVCVTRTNDDVVLSTGERARTLTAVVLFLSFFFYFTAALATLEESPSPVPHFSVINSRRLAIFYLTLSIAALVSPPSPPRLI